MSILLGASAEVVAAALPEGFAERTGDLALRLRDTRREVRAQGLAVVAQEIAVALSAVTLR